MADHSHIEWTDATWNPVTGCSVVSPGCTNCYAMKLAGTRLQHHPSRAGLTRESKTGPVWTGEVRFNEQWLTQPLRWTKPRMIFVCAHGDLFHEDVPDEWIDRVFAVMALAPQHTFQVLTKRAARMRDYIRRSEEQWHGNSENFADRFQAAMDWNLAWINDIDDMPWPLPNVWLGVSAEDHQRAEERVPQLLETPAAIRFVSAEPLLGDIDWSSLCTGWYFVDALRGLKYHDAPEPYVGASEACPHLDWVIVGGESGHGARPMHPDWARSMRDQCVAAGVPFFFKQWGSYLPGGQLMSDGRPWSPAGGSSLHASKGLAGRFLDGAEHNGMPRTAS